MKFNVNFRYVGYAIGIAVFIFLFRNLGYLFKEFLFHVNGNVKICDTCSMKYRNEVHGNKHIPNIIHQIFFPVKTKELSEELAKARQSWIDKHENYTHYLWNETSVLTFIRGNYPHLESRYKSYNYWVRRVNVARYLILFHYGGWYVDIDMTCIHSVGELGYKAASLNKSVIQHLTFPIGTSNDFFGVTPKHQFLTSVLEHLPNSDRWFIFPYPNTVLTTGTTYMWGRYLNYPYKEEFLILQKEEIQEYVRHHHHSTWHGWDALLIRTCVHYPHFIVLPVITIIMLGILWYIKSRRMYSVENTKS